MKHIRYSLLAAALLFISSGSVALADPVSQPGSPTEPMPFTVTCTPYTAPMISSVDYSPDGGACTFTIPQQHSVKAVGIYKGVPGNSVPVKRGFTLSNPSTVLTDTNFNFSSAQNGDTYFAAGYSSDVFNDVLATDGWLQNGSGASVPDLTTATWHWGLTPPVSISSPEPGHTYSSGDSVLPLVNFDDPESYTSILYTLNGTPIDPNLPLPIGTLPSGPATLVVAATNAVGTNYATSTFYINSGRAPITVTANNAQMELGSPVPALTATLSGFIAPDTASSSDITGSASCTTTANSGSAPGTYPIVCTAGTLTSPNNYSFTFFVTGTLTVTPAPLTVTADNKTMFPNSAIPTLTATLSDFVNNDTATSNDVTGVANCSTTATSGSPVGTYPITCTQGSLVSRAYVFTNYIAGTLTISPPPPTRCLWALSPTGTDLQMSGSGLIKGNGCVTQINSSSASAVSLTGTADIQAVKNCIVGGVVKTGKSSVSPAPLTNCQTAADPFATITKPVASTTCTFTNYTHSGSNAVTLQPGTYCGGMTFSGSSKITFAPGIYILKNGRLTISGSEQLIGNGISFFLTGTNAGIVSSGSGSWHFTAPTTGLLKGFVMYLDGSSSGIAASSQFSGSSDLYLEGVVYLPKQTLQFTGSGKTSALSPFTSLVADKFVMSGSGTWTLNGSTAQSSVPVPAGLYYAN